MAALRKPLKALILGLAAVVTVATGAVFPVPPLIVLARHRRSDRTELVLRARAGVALDLSRPRVPASILETGSRIG